MKVVGEAKLKAIEEFKAYKDFEVEVIESSLVMYKYGFKACKVRVT